MRQVRLKPGGLWHRHARGDKSCTACGIQILGPVATRDYDDEENEHCPLCWTSHEMDTGEMRKLEREVEDEHPDLFFDDLDDPTTPGEDTPED